MTPGKDKLQQKKEKKKKGELYRKRYRTCQLSLKK